MRLAARRIGPDAATSVAAAPCVHCGGPLGAAPVADDGLRFCCRGCSGARRLIHGLGLDRYYSLRDALGGPARPEGAEAADWTDFVETLPDGRHRIELLVEGLHCAARSEEHTSELQSLMSTS